MSTSTNTSLFNALGFFLEKMRPYVIAVIEKTAPGKPWEGELFTQLNFDQQRTWNMAQRSLTESPEKCMGCRQKRKRSLIG